MQTNNRLRTASHRGNFIQVQCRGVRGENSARLSNTVEAGKYLFLYCHVFKDCFNNEIAISEVSHIQGAGD